MESEVIEQETVIDQNKIIEQRFGIDYVDLLKSFKKIAARTLEIGKESASGDYFINWKLTSLDSYARKRIFMFQDGVYQYSINFENLPGSCGICLIYDLHIPKYLDLFLEFSEKIAFRLGFSQIMFTHVKEYYKEVALNRGYKIISEHKNARSHNIIQVYMKDLR